MKNAVRDMVERMTGGNAKVAEICVSTVPGNERMNTRFNPFDCDAAVIDTTILWIPFTS